MENLTLKDICIVIYELLIAIIEGIFPLGNNLQNEDPVKLLQGQDYRSPIRQDQ